MFEIFGVGIDRMTACRDAREEANQLRRRRIWKPVLVLGVDGTFFRGWGKTHPVVVAVGIGEGKPVEIAYLDDHNPDAVRRWLEPIVKRLGVSVIVTDDLVFYRGVAEKLELELWSFNFTYAAGAENLARITGEHTQRVVVGHRINRVFAS